MPQHYHYLPASLRRFVCYRVNPVGILFYFLLCICLLSWENGHGQYAGLIPQHYHLDIAIDFSESKLKGTAELSLKNNTDTLMTHVQFLLYRLMKVSNVINNNRVILPFKQQVVQFEDFPELQVNSVVIACDIKPGQVKKIQLSYSGYLLGYAETGMLYLRDKIDPEFTLLRNDAFAYPILAYPSMSFIRKNASIIKFTYDLFCTVPDSIVVANGGNLKSIAVKEPHLLQYHFASKKPNWRIDIAMAAYKTIKVPGLNIYYFKDSLHAARVAMQGTNTLNLFTSWWGVRKDSTSLTIIQTGKGTGGQADETTILLPEEAFGQENSYTYLYHELSHLWNTDIQEESGLSPRFEEGLATFCQYLVQQRNGKDSGLLSRTTNYFLRQMKTDLISTFELKSTPMIEYGNKQLTNYSYRLGMIMFAILYDWLGESTFNEAIATFYQQHYGRTASTEEYVSNWKRIAPEKNIDHFFRDWMFTTGYMRFVSGEYKVEDIVKYYSQK